MNTMSALVIFGAVSQGGLLAEETPAFRLEEDSPLRSDRPAGWVHETLGSTTMLRYHPGASYKPHATNTADLIAAISSVPGRGPLPLGAVSLGDYLQQSPSLQAHLADQIEAKHQHSLLKAMERPRMMPIQGVADAPPLAPIALEIIKNAPEMKEIRQALQNAGYGIVNITWDQFRIFEKAAGLRFMGNVIIHVKPLPEK